MTAAVTPLEALRRLYDVARKVDAHESGEFDCLLQGELAVAEAALREASAPVVPVAAQPVVPDAINNAFVTLVHDSGSYSISLKFNKNSDVWAVHDFLLRSGGKEYNAAAPQPAASVTDVAELKRITNNAILMLNDENLSSRDIVVHVVHLAIDAAIAAQQGEKT